MWTKLMRIALCLLGTSCLVATAQAQYPGGPYNPTIEEMIRPGGVPFTPAQAYDPFHRNPHPYPLIGPRVGQPINPPGHNPPFLNKPNLGLNGDDDRRKALAVPAPTVTHVPFHIPHLHFPEMHGTPRPVVVPSTGSAFSSAGKSKGILAGIAAAIAGIGALIAGLFRRSNRPAQEAGQWVTVPVGLGSDGKAGVLLRAEWRRIGG
jgi:hypothetical protein